MTSRHQRAALPDKLASDTRVYFRPIAQARISAMGDQLSLAGGPMSFDKVEIIVRPPDGEVAADILSVAELKSWASAAGSERAEQMQHWLQRVSAVRPAIAGLTFERPLLMGVVNITPDSFSDGGDFLSPDAAVAQAGALLEAGAEILDLGAESTRPGAAPTPADEQLRRLTPVLDKLALRRALISIDTRSAQVMREVPSLGAGLINDVSGFRHDPESRAVVAEAGVPVVLMHSRDEPATMQQAPAYDDVVLDVYDELETRLEDLEAAGVGRERIIVDPGFGFAKTGAHNIELLQRLELFHGLGCPLLVGLSRKRFIGRLSRGEVPKDRFPGSLASALWALDRGAQVLRVHDVGETRQAVQVWNALVGLGAGA